MAGYSTQGAPTNGSVYVSNLPLGTDENMLAEYFGTIGLLKVWYWPGTNCCFFFLRHCNLLWVTRFRLSYIFSYIFLERQTYWYSQDMAIPRQRD